MQGVPNKCLFCAHCVDLGFVVFVVFVVISYFLGHPVRKYHFEGQCRLNWRKKKVESKFVSWKLSIFHMAPRTLYISVICVQAVLLFDSSWFFKAILWNVLFTYNEHLDGAFLSHVIWLFLYIYYFVYKQGCKW